MGSESALSVQSEILLEGKTGISFRFGEFRERQLYLFEGVFFISSVRRDETRGNFLRT